MISGAFMTPPGVFREVPTGGRSAPRKPAVGERFGELIIESQEGRRGTSVLWLCRCDCGRSALRTSSQLNRSVRLGHSPCCMECRDELWRSRFRTSDPERRYFLRKRFYDTGSLYSPHELKNICELVRCDLVEEFGPTSDPVEECEIDEGAHTGRRRSRADSRHQFSSQERVEQALARVACGQSPEFAARRVGVELADVMSHLEPPKQTGIPIHEAHQLTRFLEESSDVDPLEPPAMRMPEGAATRWADLLAEADLLIDRITGRDAKENGT